MSLSRFRILRYNVTGRFPMRPIGNQIVGSRDSSPDASSSANVRGYGRG
jgi:hypothetical protein